MPKFWDVFRGLEEKAMKGIGGPSGKNKEEGREDKTLLIATSARSSLELRKTQSEPEPIDITPKDSQDALENRKAIFDEVKKSLRTRQQRLKVLGEKLFGKPSIRKHEDQHGRENQHEHQKEREAEEVRPGLTIYALDLELPRRRPIPQSHALSHTLHGFPNPQRHRPCHNRRYDATNGHRHFPDHRLQFDYSYMTRNVVPVYPPLTAQYHHGHMWRPVRPDIQYSSYYTHSMPMPIQRVPRLPVRQNYPYLYNIPLHTETRPKLSRRHRKYKAFYGK